MKRISVQSRKIAVPLIFTLYAYAETYSILERGRQELIALSPESKDPLKFESFCNNFVAFSLWMCLKFLAKQHIFRLK